jgi:quercetin dioxygenase-like cupin family protein
MNEGYLRAAAFVAAAALCQMQVFANGTQPTSPPAAVEQLMEKTMVGEPVKEILMLTVEYPPGGASSPHRHDAQVFVYVLEGEVTMQVEGSAAVTLHKGQTFYENPADVHLVSANASKTMPAKILVFMLKDKNAPVSRGVAPKAAP